MSDTYTQITQLVVEVLEIPLTAESHMTQAAVEAAIMSWESQARVSQAAIEVVMTGRPPMMLKDVLTDLAERVGLEANDFDFSTATQPVSGFLVTSRSAARDIISSILQFYFVDLIEVDGKLVSVNRGEATPIAIPEADLGAVVLPGTTPPRLETTRRQNVEIPWKVDLEYFSIESIEQRAVQSASRQDIEGSQEQRSVSGQIVLGDTKARQIAEALLYDAWMQRVGFKLFLPPKYLGLVPADVITLPTDQLARVVSSLVAPFGVIELEAVAEDPSILTQIAEGEGPANRGPDFWNIGNILVMAWNGNALRNEDTDSLGIYVAVVNDADDWDGCSIYSSTDGGTTYQKKMSISRVFAMGETQSALPAWDIDQLDVLDETNTLVVKVEGGTASALTTTSEAEARAGDNACLVGNEALHFCTVESLGGGVYRLTDLIRGRRGTDAFWDDHEEVEPFVVLTDRIRRVSIPEQFLEATVLMKAVPGGESVDDVSPHPIEMLGREYIPYAPYEVVGTWVADDILIDWTRRDRNDGDIRTSVPLSEESESYEIDIMDGEVAARTLTSTTPTVTYTTAQQVEDFSGLQAEITVRVYQMSGAMGRGYTHDVVLAAGS